MRGNKRWLITYYAFLLAMTVAGLVYGYIFSEAFFGSDKSPLVEAVMTALKLFWLIPLPYAFLNFYSYLRYPVFRRHTPPPITGSLRGRLYFRIVTRGTNPNLVANTVRCARHVLEATLSPDVWRIEVITDNPLPLDSPDGQVRVIVVPEDYQPPRGAKYKARALHYTLGASHARPYDWIVHLDEETCFDEETVRGMYAFAREEERAIAQGTQDFPAIGQGVILYGNRGIVNWLTTLADSIRVGDDYGRFRLQYEHGKAYFGMHGSYIVIHNSVERLIGFDHGPAGHITEDAYFALLAQSAGIRFKFVEGFMYERSPFSLSDFAKQRQRWFGGLWLCVLSPGIRLSEKIVLGTFMLLWTVSWLCILMVFVNLAYPTGTPVWLAMSGGVSFAYYVTLYMIGYLRTFGYEWRRSKAVFLLRLIAQIALIPVFSIMEAAGVFYGLFSPPKEFYIVQKELTAGL